MTTLSFKPMKTGLSRVFLIEGGAGPSHSPSYQSYVKAGAISRSFGDIESIEVPDPSAYDKFVEVGTIRGAKEDATITLTGRYALDIKSEMLRLAEKECAVDVHIVIGACEDPTNFNTFTKKIVLENASITNYDLDEIGALSSDERAVVNEAINVSSGTVYELIELTFAEKAGTVVTNEVIGVAICDTPSCGGDCENESDGYDKIFAVSLSAGGSPSTPADVIFSLDKGATWDAHDVDTLGAAEDPNDIYCDGQYVVVLSQDSGSLHYALKSEFDGTTDPSFTEVTTGFVGGPRAGAKAVNKAFIAGASGYAYYTSDPTAGVTVGDAAALYTDNYNAVSALSDDFAVMVGDAGRIIRTNNGGSTWAAITSPVGVTVNLNTVLVNTESVWFIGTSGGQLFYTLNGGTTWTEKSFTGSGTGVVRDIVKATDSVLYLSHDTTTPRGRILRSTNGGYDWVVLPEGSGVLPLSDRFTALAATDANPDFVVGVGLADDGADGIIVIGTD